MKLSLFVFSIFLCTNLCGAPWIDGAPIPTRRLRDNSAWVDAPGEKRFYRKVHVLEGEGLLSGADREGVLLVAAQFLSLDSADHLQEAKDRAVLYSGVYSGKVQDILLATKKIEKLCDILLPAELQNKVYDVLPCKHESEIQCKKYSTDIMVKIKALAQMASITHQAHIIVPEYQYSNWWQSGWYN